MTDRKRAFLDRMNWRFNWLYSQWGEGSSQPLPDDAPVITDESKQTTIRLVNGQLLIQRNGKQYTLTGVLVE